MALQQDTELSCITYWMVCELDLLLFELIEACCSLKYFTVARTPRSVGTVFKVNNHHAHSYISFMCLPHRDLEVLLLISTTCYTLYRHSLTRNSVSALERKSRVGCATFLFRRLRGRVSSHVTSNFCKCGVTLGKIYALPDPVSTR